MEVDEIINSFVETGSVPDQILVQLRAITNYVIERAGSKVNEIVSKLEASPPTYIQYTTPNQLFDLFTNSLIAVVSPDTIPTSPDTIPTSPDTIPTSPDTPIGETGITVTGFYGPSLTANILSVYLTQNAPIKPGMTITGLTGIQQRVIVQTYTSNVYGDVVINPGPPAISFPYVALVTATIQGTGTIPVAPSSLLQLTFRFEKVETKTTAHGFRGPLVSGNRFSVYIVDEFTGPRPEKDWKVTGFSDISMLLVDVSGNITVTELFAELGTANVLADTAATKIKTQQYLYRLDVVTDQQQAIPLPSSSVLLTFMSPTATIESKYYSMYDPKIFDATDIIGTPGELRDLNSNVMTSEGREVYTTVVDRGSGTGALIGLSAVGAQDRYMFGGESQWIPHIRQHTPFVVSQRLTIPLSNIGGYLGNSVQVNIFPRERGDLISNMYLKCSLPALPSGYYYTELVGRAIINKVEFIVDGIVYESITDDWYVIHDQLMLDADEKLGMYQLISNGTPEGSNVTATNQIDLFIPLEFFFCRRFTHMRENKKPYFPMCAIMNSTISVRFTFNKASWITNAPIPVELIRPQLLVEEITLSPRERMYYQSQPMNLRIPRVWKEAVQTYSGGIARMNLTADFKVSMITWFIRNKAYEKENSAYYSSRYSYGYTTDYIVAATPVTFFNGVQLRYIDTIDYATLYLNNQNVLSNFPGGLYYTFKQAIDHKLSVPTKNLYMYCFSERPLEYNHDGGSMEFSKLSSQTTHLDIKFLEQYAPQIQAEYSLNLFYYGYINIQIANGRVTRI